MENEKEKTLFGLPDALIVLLASALDPKLASLLGQKLASLLVCKSSLRIDRGTRSTASSLLMGSVSASVPLRTR